MVILRPNWKSVRRVNLKALEQSKLCDLLNKYIEKDHTKKCKQNFNKDNFFLTFTEPEG